MGVVARKSIHAFVYHVAGGRGSWQLCDRSGVGAWPQLFGDIASLNDMLNVPKSREDLGSLAEIPDIRRVRKHRKTVDHANGTGSSKKPSSVRSQWGSQLIGLH